MAKSLNLPLLAIMSFLSLTARADEGLFFEQVPKEIKAAWDASILLVARSSEGPRICSAFLIEKEVVKGRNYLVFLSAGHCATLNLGFPEDKAVDDRQLLLSSFETYSDVQIDISKSDWRSRITGEPFQESIEPVWSYQQSPYATPDHASPFDYLVLAFEARGNVDQLNPIALADQVEMEEGAKNFIIGFPGVTTRSASQQRVPIPEPTILRKRWSAGNLIKTVSSNFLQSTADSLPGDSGGASVGISGKFVGIYSGSGELNPSQQSAPISFVYSPKAFKNIIDNKISIFRKFAEAQP